MFLAKVKGNIVSTHKNEHLHGHKLMLVREIDPDGNFISNKDMISVDLIDAGVGDTVIVAKEGKAVQQILGHRKSPINTIIIGIVDNIELEE
jgi:microcompartment protein CcmK/EutM